MPALSLDRGSAREIDGGRGERGDVLSGRHVIVEGQGVRARTLLVIRGSAVIQGQRWPPNDGHRLAEGERERDRLVPTQIAGRWRFTDPGKGWRCRIDLRPRSGSGR